jgi:hypothetical protein
MSTICDLDLQPDTETTLRLIHWDNISGDDTILLIHKDGTVEKYLGEDDDGYDITKPVSLFDALNKLLP